MVAIHHPHNSATPSTLPAFLDSSEPHVEAEAQSNPSSTETHPAMTMTRPAAGPSHSTYRMQAPPQVYARVYDLLAARCAAEAQGLAHSTAVKRQSEIKRDREQQEITEDEGEDEDSTCARKRIKKEDSPAPVEPTISRRADTSSPPSLLRNPIVSESRSELAHDQIKADPDSSSSSSVLEREVCAPTSVHLFQKRRSVSSPPELPSPCPPPPVPAHARAKRHSTSIASADSSSSSRNKRRRKSAEALVDVIKSFEVVLQYRALGWRIFESAPTAIRPLVTRRETLPQFQRSSLDSTEDNKEPQRRFSTRY